MAASLSLVVCFNRDRLVRLHNRLIQIQHKRTSRFYVRRRIRNPQTINGGKIVYIYMIRDHSNTHRTHTQTYQQFSKKKTHSV